MTKSRDCESRGSRSTAPKRCIFLTKIKKYLNLLAQVIKIATCGEVLVSLYYD